MIYRIFWTTDTLLQDAVTQSDNGGKKMRNFNALKYIFASALAVCTVLSVASCKKDDGDGDHTHTFGDWTVTEPTCTEAGKRERACTGCDHTEEESIAALGHTTVSHSEKAATCTEDGYAAYVTCTECDYTTYSKISATGHSIVEHEAKAHTCTEDGHAAYETCENCSYTTYEKIPAQHNFNEGVCTECGEEECEEHSFGDWYGNTATCERGGKEYRKCSECGFVVSRDTEIKPHAIVGHEAKDPTCTEPGHEAYETCENCSYTTYEEIPAGHKFEGGKCTVCGADKCTTHSYGAWYGNTATCKAGGVEYRECSECGNVDQRNTSKSSHKYENKVCIWCGAKDYTLPPQPLGAKKDD